MTNRPTEYTLDVVVNGPDEERDFDHPKMDFEELMTMLDSYVVGDGTETSWVFTVVKRIPKDWVVVIETGTDREVFGPFLSSEGARYWAEEQLDSDANWQVLAIDKPTFDEPKPQPGDVELLRAAIGDGFDPENIYGLPSMQQSIEEDRR